LFVYQIVQSFLSVTPRISHEEANADRGGETPASNRLSYDATKHFVDRARRKCELNFIDACEVSSRTTADVPGSKVKNSTRSCGTRGTCF
jgi:hypothetical protein